MWTKQCEICGHHYHYPESCIVGTDKFWKDGAEQIHQINCSCDGIHKESCTDL